MNPNDLSAIPRNERGIEIESPYDGRHIVVPGWWCWAESLEFHRGLFNSATIRDLMLSGN